MAVAGKKGLIKIAGSLVAFTDEACTNTVTNLEYQITNTVKRVWDRTATITVKVGGSPVSSTTYTLNRLTGTVIFTSASVRTVTITGSYLPMSTAAEAKSWSLAATTAMVEVPIFGDTFTTKIRGLKDVSGALSSWKTTDTYFTDALQNGTPIVLEFYTDSSAAFISRAWAYIDKADIAAVLNGAVDQPVTFVGTTDADNRMISG